MDIFTKKFGTLDLDLDPPTHSLGQSPKKIRFFFYTFPKVPRQSQNISEPIRFCNGDVVKYIKISLNIAKDSVQIWAFCDFVVK